VENIKFLAKKIEVLAKEAQDFKRYKSILQEGVKQIKQKYQGEEYNSKLNEFLKGKTEKEWLDFYNNRLNQIFNEIEKLNNQILSSFEEKTIIKKPVLNIDRKTKKKYLKELNLNEAYLKEISPGKDKLKKEVFKKYKTYELNPFAKISNTFVGKLTLKLIKKYPALLQRISYSLHLGNIKILSKSYISIAFFSSFLMGLITLILGLFVLKLEILSIILMIFLLPSLVVIVMLAGFYFYPIIIANSRKQQIKNDLPFVIMHMSAVAGSGAQPISMFNLITKSKEYPGLESEIKKIVNYVNLFGYDLSTALRSVSMTTPSPEFKDLLIGLVTTIEGGGSLKDYLEAKGEEAMIAYKLERKKFIESLSTYSDIYTGVFIAAPLLFFVTLAIIQTMGGGIFGLSVDLLSKLGTFILLPIINVMFLLFLDMVKPD
jgi:pilus assembly protein TadC